MRALVTGSAGLVGRNMVAELEARGYYVQGWDIADGIDANEGFAYGLRWNAGFDLLVHCAYHVGGRAAIDGVNTNFAKNLELDARMFRFALENDVRRVLYFSSSAAYPVALQEKSFIEEMLSYDVDVRLSEDDICLDASDLPDANYGWAKLTGERLAADARRNGLAVTVVRPASGCSADQDDTYPFVALAKRVVAKQRPLVVWGGEQYRDFIDISDVVKGSLAIVDSETTDPVNICQGRATSMTELVQMMWFEAHGSLDELEIQFDASRPMGVYYRVLDSSRFNQYYRPHKSLEVMVSEVVQRLRTIKVY